MDEPAKEIQGRKREREEGATEGLPEGSQAAKKFRFQSPSSPMEQPAKNDEREDIEGQGRKRERERRGLLRGRLKARCQQRDLGCNLPRARWNSLRERDCP